MGRDLDSDDESRDDGFKPSPVGNPGANETHDHEDDQELPRFFLRESRILDETGSGDPETLIPPQWRRFLRIEKPPKRPETSKNRRLAVTLNADKSEITVDGKTYPVKYEIALFVDALIKAGNWISGPELRTQSEFFSRPDRVRDQVLKAVPPLDGYIETKHRGFRLKPEMLE